MKKIKVSFRGNGRHFMASMLAVILLVLAVTGFQQVKDCPDNREEIHRYVKSNIMPVVLAERKILELELSGGEKAQIHELRLRMEEMRPRRRGGKPNGGRLQSSEWNRERIRQHRQEMDEVLTAAEDIIADHIQTIENSFSVLENSREQWRDDIETLVGHNIPDDVGHRRGPGVMKFLGRQKHIGFLLLDPEMNPEEMGFGSNLRIYPNPSVHNSTLEYVVKETGQVVVQVLDNNGNVVLTPYSGLKDPGTHQVQIDLSGLEDGVYIYTISTPTGSQSRKVVKGNQRQLLLMRP